MASWLLFSYILLNASLQEQARTGTVPRGDGPSTLGHSQDLHGPWATSSSLEGGPLWCRGLHCAASPGPFQRNLFCCSMVLCSWFSGQTRFEMQSHLPQSVARKLILRDGKLHQLFVDGWHVMKNLSGKYPASWCLPSQIKSDLMCFSMNFRKELGWVQLSFQCSSQGSTVLPCYRSTVPGQAVVQNVNVLPCAQATQKNTVFSTSITLSLLFLLSRNSTISVIAWSEISYYFNPASPFVWHQFLIKHVTSTASCNLSQETLKS